MSRHHWPEHRHSAGSAVLTLMVVLVAIALLVSALVIYKRQQTNRAIATQHAQYNQAEKDLDATVARITTKFGKPDDSAKDKSCGYTSNPDEFEKGDLYCNVDEYLLYGVTDQVMATRLVKQIEQFLGDKNVKYDDQTEAGNLIPPIRIGGASYQDHDLDCSRGYTYETKQSLALYATDSVPLLKNLNEGLLLELGCSARHPKMAYYPIENS